jgi:hypothetical protein
MGSNLASGSAWPPTTEDALNAAADEGNLTETHSVELKRELPSGDGANKELAADLASLAIDGGFLFIGVDETTGPGLSPVPLKGLAERVEQVGLSRIDEPLHVVASAVPSVNDPANGYLVVRVPASPRAPHMVGHRYWGRGEKTKYQLSDGEVERLMVLRERWAANAKDALRDWMAHDPITLKQHENGHLFVVASPVPPRDRMWLPLFGGDDWRDVLRRLVSETSHSAGTFVPDIPNDLYNFATTPDGWSWHSYTIFGERAEGEQSSDREDRGLLLEVCEDGPLRLWCGRATLRLHERLHVFDSSVLGLTARMITLAHSVGRAGGFFGSWDFGVGVTGLKNARLYVPQGFNTGPLFSQASYTGTTRAATTEIEAGTGPILGRLLGRLMRAIGGDHMPSIKAQLQPRKP